MDLTSTCFNDQHKEQSAFVNKNTFKDLKDLRITAEQKQSLLENLDIECMFQLVSLPFHYSLSFPPSPLLILPDTKIIKIILLILTLNSRSPNYEAQERRRRTCGKCPFKVSIRYR